MKSLVQIAIVTGLTVASASAFAASNNQYYGKVTGGMGKLHGQTYTVAQDSTAKTTRYDSGEVGNIAFGVINNGMRFDLSMEHSSNKAAKGMVIFANPNSNATTSYRTSMSSLMANAYIDKDIAESYFAYVGAGLGTGRVKLSQTTREASKRETSSNKTQVLAYQATAGFGSHVTENVKVSTNYRYLATSHFNQNLSETLNVTSTTSPRYKNNTVNMEVMYTF